MDFNQLSVLILLLLLGSHARPSLGQFRGGGTCTPATAPPPELRPLESDAGKNHYASVCAKFLTSMHTLVLESSLHIVAYHLIQIYCLVAHPLMTESKSQLPQRLLPNS